MLEIDPSSPDSFSLKGHLLLAMPGMEDERFSRTVILVCSHSKEGSMGFILNQQTESPSFPDILRELGMEDQADLVIKHDRDRPIFRGGPVEQGRGFVLHSLDYSTPASARVEDLCAVTATIDVLRVLAGENPPEQAIMFLGYAGWSEGQLEEEIAQNGWLTLPATPQLVFETEAGKQYEAALAELGVSEATLSAFAGHA